MGSPVRPTSYSADNPFAPRAASTGHYSPDNPFAGHEPPAVAAESTGVHPAPATPAGGDQSMGDVLASGLTFGLAPKIGAAGKAAIDLIEHHSPAHAGQVYNATLAENRTRLANTRAAHPNVSAAVEAAGTVVPTAVTTLIGGYGPLRAAMGLPAELGEAASFGQRVGQAARVGAGTGGVIAGATSDGPLPSRLRQTAAGMAGGAVLGAGGQIVGEAAGAATRLGKSLLTPAATKAQTSADQQLMRGFANDGGVEAAVQRAEQDQRIGAPSLVTHTGGANVNSLAWKAVSTPSKGAARLSSALVPIKQQEGEVLSRGLGEAANVGDRSAPEAIDAISRRQKLSAHHLYERAYAEPDVQDSEITRTIAAQPRLMDAAQKTLDIMEREGTATDADRRAVQALHYLRSTPGAAENPTMLQAMAQPLSVRFLDTMKRGADDLVQAGLTKDATFTKLDAASLRGAVAKILDRVDAQRPAYAQARLVFKSDADRKGAIALGQDALAQSPADAALSRRTLAPQNEPDYRLGAVDAFRQKIAKKVPTSAYTRTVFGPTDRQQHLDQILGDSRAAFDPYLDYGQRVEATHQRVFGGSSTAGNLKVDAPDQGATPLDAASLARHPIRSTLGTVLSRLKGAQSKSFQELVADALAERLAAPTGTPQSEAIYNRLRELRDENSADALGQSAARLFRLRNAVGVTGGVLAGRGQ